MSATLHLDEKNFDEVISTADKPVLVDFWAPWCGPCRRMGPVIDALAEEMETAVIAKVDVEANPLIQAKFGITTIPTFIIFKNGEVVETVVGSRPKAELKEIVEKYL